MSSTRDLGLLAVPGTPAARQEAGRLAKALNCRVLGYHVDRFASGNIQVRLDETPAPAATVILYEGRETPDAHLVELGLVADAVRRCHSNWTACCVRYLPYSRSNRITDAAGGLGAKVFIDLLCALPIDHFLTFDLHAPELLGFFTKPVVSVSLVPVIVGRLKNAGAEYDCILGVDRGRYDECNTLGSSFACETDFFLKRRVSHDGAAYFPPLSKSHLRGAQLLLFDDEFETGASSRNALDQLADCDVKHVDFACIYDVASAEAFEGLMAHPLLQRFASTNAIAATRRHGPDVLTADVAKPLARALGLLLRTADGG